MLRGNLVDLAVAVVLGAAFGAVVTSLVSDIITPLIAALGGQPDFAALTFRIGDGVFRYGDFLNALLSFLIIAAVLFFFVVKPMNALLAAGQVRRRGARRAGSRCPAPDGDPRPAARRRPRRRLPGRPAGARELIERPAATACCGPAPTLRHSATKFPTVRTNFVAPASGRLPHA